MLTKLRCLVATVHMIYLAWWRHQMETFSALLAICAGNSPVTGEFHAQRPVTRIFDFFSDLMFSLICAWIKGCVNNREAADLRCHLARYDVILMGIFYQCGSATIHFIPAEGASLFNHISQSSSVHVDGIKWKHFPRYWPFVRGIHRSLVNSPHKGQWRGALLFLSDLRLNKRLSKQCWGWWFETPSCPLWRHSLIYSFESKSVCKFSDTIKETGINLWKD